LTRIKIGFNEDIFYFRMILAEGLGRILSLSHKTFAGLLDSRRSDIVVLSMVHLVDVLRSILMLPEHINIPAA
jgi:hypothetical protein